MSLADRDIAPRAAAALQPTPVSLQPRIGSAPGGGPAPAAFLSVRKVLAVLTLIAPTLAALIYLFGIAADRYVSETHFVLLAAPGPPGGDARGAVDFGGRVSASSYAVRDWLLSRDALDLLLRQNDLRAVLARPEADPLNRFPGFLSGATREALFRRYASLVRVAIDEGTGIVTLRVESFRATDSRGIAQALLSGAERFVNGLNARADMDVLDYAQSYVRETRTRLSDIEDELTRMRGAVQSIDPVREAAARSDAMARMAVDLARRKAAVAEARLLTPQGPSLASSNGAVQALESGLQQETHALTSGAQSLAADAAPFERLSLERDIAARMLAAALTYQGKAREEASRQHLFLQTLAAPSLPDEAAEPRKLFWMLAIMAISACVYIILSSLHAITMEHES